MKVLMVVTSHDQLGNTGRKTGGAGVTSGATTSPPRLHTGCRLFDEWRGVAKMTTPRVVNATVQRIINKTVLFR